MEFTTHLELQSQTTRLFESRPQCEPTQAKDGVFTLYDAFFLRTYAWEPTGHASINYNSNCQRQLDFKFELFPLHSPLLRESLLVSFPPLIYMLKFSG